MCNGFSVERPDFTCFCSVTCLFRHVKLRHSRNTTMSSAEDITLFNRRAREAGTNPPQERGESFFSWSLFPHRTATNIFLHGNKYLIVLEQISYCTGTNASSFGPNFFIARQQIISKPWKYISEAWKYILKALKYISEPLKKFYLLRCEILWLVPKDFVPSDG